MVKTEVVVFVDEEEVMFPGFSSDIRSDLHTKGEKCLVKLQTARAYVFDSRGREDAPFRS